MTRPYYAPKQVYLGNGTLDTYSFDFKLENVTQLLLVVVDDNGDEFVRVRGDDTSFIGSVSLTNPLIDGGYVILNDNLPNGYTMALILANDEPAQTYEFSNKSSFNLKRFERALDFIVGPIQRLVLRANQSLRIHDLDDEETFNTQLPPGITNKGNSTLIIKEDGTRFDYGPTVIDILGWKNDAEAAAAAAAVSEGNALASANAADAARIAAEAAQAGAELAESNTVIIAAQALLDITNAKDAAIVDLGNTKDAAIVDINAARDAALVDVANSTVTAQNAANDAEAARDAAILARDAAQGYAQDAIDAAAAVTPKYQFIALQNIAANGKITVNALYPMQFVKVQGNGGPQTVNASPFVTPPDNGGVVTLVGQDDAKILTILANAQMLLKGDLYLGKNQSASLVYELASDTYTEIYRSL